jgi:hypothetical protein
MSSVKLVSSEGSERTISVDLAKKSNFLLKFYERDPERPIKIQEVNSKTLDLIIEYIELIAAQEPKPIPEVLKSNNLQAELEDDVFFKFINKVDFEGTFQLINAGLQFELLHLHDLACAKIAAFMKDKSPEDINQEFTIECQLTTEEAKNLGLEVDS